MNSALDKPPVNDSYLCTMIYIALYVTAGKWEGAGPRKSNFDLLFLGPLKGIEPLSECQLGPKKSLLLKLKKVEGRLRPTQQQCQIPPGTRSGFLTLLV